MNGKFSDKPSDNLRFCNHYASWDKDTRILYLEQRLAFLVQSMVKQESLHSAQARMLRILEQERKESQRKLEERNSELTSLSRKLQNSQKELEALVKQRTEKLESKSLKLAQYARELKRTNITLDIMLKKKDNDARKLLQTSLDDLRSQILPDIDRLANLVQDKKQKSLVLRIFKRLKIFNTSQCDNSWSTCLSGREAQVADLISQSKTHSQVADILGVSIRTVNAHTNKIRKKLNVPHNIRLKDFLEEISRMN